MADFFFTDDQTTVIRTAWPDLLALDRTEPYRSFLTSIRRCITSVLTTETSLPAIVNELIDEAVVRILIARDREDRDITRRGQDPVGLVLVIIRRTWLRMRGERRRHFTSVRPLSSHDASMLAAPPPVSTISALLQEIVDAAGLSDRELRILDVTEIRPIPRRAAAFHLYGRADLKGVRWLQLEHKAVLGLLRAAARRLGYTIASIDNAGEAE